MNIREIDQTSLSPTGNRIGEDKRIRQDPISDFKEIFTNSLAEVAQMQVVADRSVEQMVLGSSEIHETMIAMEKAGISRMLLVQVRNKMIAAYEEVIRMQF
jgi:flagellar hook-basal body complex protein FliE